MEDYMKRSIKWLAILSVLLVALMAFTLVACNKNSESDDSSNTDTSTNTNDTNTDSSDTGDTNTGDTNTNDSNTNDTNDTNVPPEDTNTDTTPKEIYKVTFRQGNGIPDVVMDIERGTCPELPEIQPEEGYYLEWEVTDFSNLSGDGLVCLNRTPIYYEVEYVVGEGENNDNNPESVTIADVVVLADPTRVGCEFAGWYADAACTQKITEISKGTNKKITIYAAWTPIEYTVSYDAAGGNNNANNPAVYNVDSEITLLPASKDNYDFVGWYIKDTDTKVETTEDIVGNVELEARWIIERFEITYGGVTADEHSNPADFDYTESFTFTPAERDGYTFGGWYLDASYTTPITGISANTKQDKTVYAKMTIITYNISYTLGTGMTNNSANITKYDVNTEFEFIAPTYKDGFEFAGWFIKGTDTKVEAIVPGGEMRQNLNLEARFEYEKFYITFNANGGTLPGGTQNYYTVENVGSNAYVLPTPVKPGYKFLGWYENPNFTTSPVTKVEGSQQKDIVLYANWIVESFKITYNYGITGTVANTNPTSYSLNNVVEFTNLSKDGYIFLGWFTDSGFNNQITTTEGHSGALTLYAKWIQGSNIADQATITTTSGCWICDQEDMKWIVDGDRGTAIGGDYNSSNYILTFDYGANEYYVKNVVVVCNGKGVIASNYNNAVTEMTTKSFDIILTAYDKNGNVVYQPTTMNPSGEETVEFEINAQVAKIEIKVFTQWDAGRNIWEVEINGG